MSHTSVLPSSSFCPPVASLLYQLYWAQTRGGNERDSRGTLPTHTHNPWDSRGGHCQGLLRLWCFYVPQESGHKTAVRWSLLFFSNLVPRAFFPPKPGKSALGTRLVFLPYSRRLECLIIDRCKTKAMHPSLSLSVILRFWMPIRPGCEHGPTTPNWDTQPIELNIYSQRFWMASVHHGLTVPLQGWCNMRVSSDSVLPWCVPTGNRAWKVSGTQGTCCDTF